MSAASKYHIGSARGTICSSRRTGYVKRRALTCLAFAATPEDRRCVRCVRVFRDMVKARMITEHGVPPKPWPITKT